MIISVHMPKTAGSSFKSVLEKRFGERVLFDYADLPINTPTEIRIRNALNDADLNTKRDFTAYDCIHGHFLPAKYSPLKESQQAIFVTWLREPLARMVSHYNFWLRTYSSTESPPLHRKMIEENWSLERFCFCEELRNFYGQFLWRFPITSFDFVGITEHFAEDLSFFSRHFLAITATQIPLLNASPAGAQTAEWENLRQRFTDFHSDDCRLYRLALALRGQRLRSA